MEPENKRSMTLFNTPSLFSFEMEGYQSVFNLSANIQKNFHPFPESAYPMSLYKIPNNNPIKVSPYDIGSTRDQVQVKIAKPVKKGSIYHNFQKHLVTTLKINIHLSYDKKTSNTPQKLACQLWEYFIKSRKPTKKFLYSLLKSAPSSIIDQEKRLKKKNDHAGFQAITKNLGLEEIREAQTCLRLEIVNQSRKLMESGLLMGRRMQKMEQFQDYFSTFINDVQRNDLTLRLSKKKVKPQEAEQNHSAHNIQQEK